MNGVNNLSSMYDEKNREGESQSRQNWSKLSLTWNFSCFEGVDGAEEDQDHVVDQGHQDGEGRTPTRLQSTRNRWIDK